MATKERHRQSLIIATLGPSTDDEKELKTMIIAGIARQWTDGVDIARILFSDGSDISKQRVENFRKESKKRDCKTHIYLDTDNVNLEEWTSYINFAKEIQPKYFTVMKKQGLEKIIDAKNQLGDQIQVGVRVQEDDDTSDLEEFYKNSNFAMIEIDSKKIVNENIVQKAKDNDCEPMYLAKMPTLMKGQVQSREENFEIGHTLEEGFDVIALYQETSHGPYPARSVKCIDEIAVESEKLRINPLQDLIDKIMSFFGKRN
ncbi:MAG: hypothetical protein CMD88_05130 [Gammaproteobacteria bacterium]|nr:hypothetical protein [Gammaproteobacteria bacterium]|tara:strand:- start:41582 stop:42358 length:777 start_codon:yes stop_codon:yes gene_type:complete